MGVIGDAAYCPSPISGTGTSVAHRRRVRPLRARSPGMAPTTEEPFEAYEKKSHEAVCRSSAETAAGGAGDCESGDGVGEAIGVLIEVLWIGSFVGEGW